MREPLPSHKDTNEDFIAQYMPIAEFSAIKNIPEDKVIKMIREGFYVGQIKGGQWFVARHEASGHEQQNIQASAATGDNNFLKKLIRGDFGLALTFWFWGVCMSFILAKLFLIPMAFRETETLLVPLLLTWFAYVSLAFIAIWQAAKHSPLWGIIARLFVIAAFPTIAYVVFYIVGLATSNYPAN